MPLAPESWTADMVLALPEDGQRHEVVNGELLVSPPPRWSHERVAGNLYFLLKQYCRRHSLGEVMSSPAAVSWNPNSLVQPDVFVIDPSQAGGDDWRTVTKLSLVVEVLSPSTARHDRASKRKLYQENGVGTLWLVDADRRQVEVWTPEARFPVIESERVTWHPAGVREPLVIPISEFFRAD